MNLMNKIRRFQVSLAMKLMKGKIEFEQQRAEKMRKKHKQISEMKPGAVKTLREGLAMKKGVFQVMKEEWERRQGED